VKTRYKSVAAILYRVYYRNIRRSDFSREKTYRFIALIILWKTLNHAAGGSLFQNTSRVRHFSLK